MARYFECAWEHMFTNYFGLEWINGEVFAGFFKRIATVSSSMHLWSSTLGCVPVVKEIIMQKRSANKALFVAVPSHSASDFKTNAGRTNHVFSSSRGAVLNIFVRFRIFFWIQNVCAVTVNKPPQLFVFLFSGHYLFTNADVALNFVELAVCNFVSVGFALY